ncbi:MAG: DUF1080 domain-containing protein [Verrucomicrobiales bacterium]
MKTSLSTVPAAICAALAAASAAIGAPKLPVPTWTNPKLAASAHIDFTLQGEYRGEREGGAVGVQAADIGDGNFHVLTYRGGLPGDGWDGSAIEAEKVGRGELKTLVAELKRVERESETLGKKAPEGAIVVFDGEKTEHIKGGVKKGLLMAGAKTTTAAGDFHLHVEFRLPFKPDRPLSSQDRGNSGLYIFDNYEVQVLDTFGLDFDADNNAVETESLNTQWCASLYKFKAPDVPMAFPPLRWQTYDIDFTAPRFEGEEKVENARITVRHNGVVVHDDLELPGGTGAGAKRPEKEKGTLLFQDHGNPVAFRNVWLVEEDEE